MNCRQMTPEERGRMLEQRRRNELEKNDKAAWQQENRDNLQDALEQGEQRGKYPRR